MRILFELHRHASGVRTKVKLVDRSAGGPNALPHTAGTLDLTATEYAELCAALRRGGAEVAQYIPRRSAARTGSADEARMAHR